MKFIGQLTKTTNWRANVLTDGQLQCTYQQIPELFESINKEFEKQSISSEDCLVLECENSVPCALVLLYLLEKGNSVLLLPKTPKEAEPFLPGFCRFRIVTESVSDNGKIVELTQPEQFLQITANENWLEGANNSSQKLYLRTSGSTGKPKIAMHSHGKVLGNVANCVERLLLQSEDRIAIPVPIYHMYGLGAGFLPGVAVGAAIDLQKGANLLRYLQREKQFAPNVAFMTPIFCETLLKGRKSPRWYRMTVAAGDRVREEAFSKYESLFGCLVKLYGSTEMGAIAAASPSDSPEIRAQTVGKPMSGVEMRLENIKEEGKPIGQLWCKHEYSFDGYIDENGQPIVISENNDWFWTKDLGCIDLDGYIEVLGRADHSVNRDGLLVFFADVEKAIETIAGIEAVVVVSKGESQRGKGIVAYCILAKDTNLTEADIRTSCFDLLPKRAIPDRINIVNSLPLLPNGKVDRQKLIGMEDKIKVKIMQ